MLPLNACSRSSPHLLQWGTIERSNAFQVAVKPVNISLNRGHVWKSRTFCSQGFRKTGWITNKSDKSFKREYVGVGLQKEHALQCKDQGSNITEFQNFLWKKLKAFYAFSRPTGAFGLLTIAISASLLPVQTMGDLSIALFAGMLKALVPAFFMILSVIGMNDLFDVEIDKINKPYLPLASGDISMETGIAITSAAFAMSLGMAIMLSPPLFFGLLIYFLAGIAYSVDLPFLRWKKHPLLAIICGVVFFQSMQLGFFAHIQKYVLGKSIAVTKSLVFAIVVSSFLAVLFALFKFAFNRTFLTWKVTKLMAFQTLSIKLGKENVFWLCIKMSLMAYGAAVVVGATSSSLPSRLITVIGHCLLATLLLFRAQSIDLTSKTSIVSFYLFFWKLLSAEYFLVPFVR